MPGLYLLINGEQKGPFPAEQVRAMLARGEITPATLAWREGLTEWSPVSTVMGTPPGAPLPPPAPVKKGMSGWLIALIVVAVLAVLSVPCCCGIALGPVTAGIKKAKEVAVVQQVHAINLAMFAYANDHNNAYPDGATSTEVFQKLIDGGYVTDPAIFYVAMPGKTKPTSNHLTADNVSFDVTSGATTASPSSLPLVFLTGYTVTYEAGASATLDSSSGTPFSDGIVVGYVNNSSSFVKAGSDGSIPNFVASDFDAGGKTYTQLKP